jgi:hypothetical protein
VSQSKLDPELLLFRDKSGRPAQFQDVVDDGLDGGYEDRVPGLIAVLHHGAPYHQLLAAAMLAAWCQPAGFEAIRQWASHPSSVPWKEAPASFDRISGADASFETLADALRTGAACDDQVAALRLEATRAMLRHVSARFLLDRTLALAILRDTANLPQLAPDLRAALDASLARLRAPERPEFNLAFQAASLLMPLARLDDAATASYAEQLLDTASAKDNPKLLRELANAMAEGSGPATGAILQRLETLAVPSVEPDLRSALRRRSAKPA